MRLRRIAARDADPQEYVTGANAAFGAWGDEAMFAWVFRGDAEILFLDDDHGRPLAASGISWRTLDDGQRTAIMTGSWTSLEARGRGAFTRMFEATRSAARERDAAVLAFFRADNVSCRPFEANGARMSRSFYCRSTEAEAPRVALQPIEPDPAAFATGFRYTPAEWRTQFLERPNAVIECIGIRGEWSAVVERTADFDRIQAMTSDAALPHLAARAHASGRRLFWFTTRQPAFRCEWTDGFIGTIPPAPISGAFQNGDRM